MQTDTGPEDNALEKMKTTISPVDIADDSSVRSAWFQQIEILHQSITELSNLECATRCSARCCPKAKESTPVGHIAIMLPFEREYVLSKVDLNPDELESSLIEFTANTTIKIGIMTQAVPCPFLTSNHQCGIYDIRPLDCRSFPLIPIFNKDGSIQFRIENECPSAVTFSPSYEEELKVIWQKILPLLPMSYRLLYNDL
jgi:Fe-S-cluster containining protein